MRTQVHNVNMQVGAGIPPIVKVSQYDELRVIGFRLFDGSRAYFPGEDDVVTITGTKPSGLGFTEECSVNGSVVSVETTLAMTQESGNINAELRISDGSTNIGTANFTLYIEPAPHPAGTTDGTTEEARTVLEQCAQYAQEAHEAASDVAPQVEELVDAAVADKMEEIEDAVQSVTDAASQAVSDIAAAGEAVEESIPADYTALSAQVSQLQADLDAVEESALPKPTTSPTGTSGQILRSKGNGQTEWADFGTPTDAQVGNAVDTWLVDHPEATTTVQDGAITDIKTADSYKNLFYNEVVVSTGRTANTDYYLALVPKHDANENIIPVSLSHDENHNLLEQAGQNGSTLTVNGYCSVLYDGEYHSGISICSGVVVSELSYYGVAPDNMLYLGMKPDRTILEYKMNSDITPAQMLADGCTDVFNCYFKLVENGQVVDALSEEAIVINGTTITESLRNPLMLMGVKNNGDIVFLACDGRTQINDGLSYREGGNLLISQGCTTVYNLDGGGSTAFIFKGAKLNRNIDGNGVSIRNIRYALNVIKQSANTPTKGAYAKIGYEKQKIIEQIIPYINSVNDSNITKIGAAIVSGSDLNDITVEGKYYCTNSAIAQTLDNCPVTVGFSMYCLQQGGTGRAVLQLLIKNPSSTTGAQTIYYRTLIKDASGDLTTIYDWTQFTPYTESVTLSPGADVSLVRSNCNKSGKTVTLSAVFTTENSIAKNTSIFTVPDNVKPSATVDFIAASTNSEISLLSLSSNGNINVVINSMPAGTHRVNASWQVN